LSLEQGREVFVVPGPTRAEDSAGCRDLVRSGAKAVFTADDVLVDLAPLLAVEMREALQKRLAKKPHNDAGSPLASSDYPLPLQAESPEGQPASSAAKGKKNATLAPSEKTAVPTEADFPILSAPAPKREEKNTPLPVALTIADDTSLSSNAPNIPTSCAPAPTGPVLTPDEEAIVAALACGPMHIDELCRALDRDASRLSGMLTMLEIRGVICRQPGMFYSL